MECYYYATMAELMMSYPVGSNIERFDTSFRIIGHGVDSDGDGVVAVQFVQGTGYFCYSIGSGTWVSALHPCRVTAEVP